MPGAKIPVLEIENLVLTKDSRGLVLYDDATNFVINSASPWISQSYPYSSSTTRTDRPGLPTASSMGWLKIHYISGSTYGATGATAYIPIFRNLNIKIA